jgi:hypothetical protein
MINSDVLINLKSVNFNIIFHIRALEVLFLLGYGAASVAECWCPTFRENIVVSSSEADIFRNITENT